MNILFISSAITDSSWASSIHMKEIAYNLSREHKVFVIAEPEHGLTPKRNVELKQVTIPLLRGNNPLVAAIKRCMLVVSTFIVGLNTAKSSELDVIYVRHGTNSLGGILLSKIFHIPIVLEVNGLFYDEGSLLGFSNFQFIRPFLELLDVASFRFATRIVSVTGNIKMELHKKYGVPLWKIIVVPNGANTNKFRPMDTKSVRKYLRVKETSRIICYVGSLVPWQGLEYLMQALPFVTDAVPETQLIIVGDGPLRETITKSMLELRLENHVSFKGEIPYDEAPFFINSSDVCVVLKKVLKSGFSPLKLFEYLACGKPVVATRTNGFEILENYNAGVLVNPENTQETARALVKLLSDDKLRETMGRNGRDLVTKKYSWEIAAKRVAEVCKEAKTNVCTSKQLLEYR